MTLTSRLVALERRAPRTQIPGTGPRRPLTDAQIDKILRRLAVIHDTEGRDAVVRLLTKHMGPERAEAFVVRIEEALRRQSC